MIIEDNIVNLSFINHGAPKIKNHQLTFYYKILHQKRCKLQKILLNFKSWWIIYIQLHISFCGSYYIPSFICFSFFVIISILLKTKHENLFGNSKVPGTKTIFFKRIENYLHKSKSVHILSIFTKCNMYTIKLKLR